MSKRAAGGHTHKPRPRRPITLNWACGCRTKSWERDPQVRADLKRQAKRAQCEACQREAQWRGRRDIGTQDPDEEDLLALFPTLGGAA